MGDYKYNGIVLPALPKYDTTAYAHAWIYKNMDFDSYVLAVSDGSLYVTTDSRGKTIIAFSESVSGKTYSITDGAWSSPFDFGGDDSRDLFYDGGDYRYFYPEHYALIWVNTDVLKTDGSVYMAATEPVPIEPEEPEEPADDDVVYDE